jgi:hypothetical protein
VFAPLLPAAQKVLGLCVPENDVLAVHAFHPRQLPGDDARGRQW